MRLPEERRFPGRALSGPLSCLKEARYGIVWGAVGAARACFEAALDYATTRTLGAPIAPARRSRSSSRWRRSTTASWSRSGSAGSRTREAQPAHMSLGKFTTSAAPRGRAVRRGLLGGNGITLEYPVMRHMVNLESVFTYEGTHEIHTLVLGQAITGLSAFR